MKWNYMSVTRQRSKGLMCSYFFPLLNTSIKPTWIQLIIFQSIWPLSKCVQNTERSGWKFLGIIGRLVKVWIISWDWQKLIIPVWILMPLNQLRFTCETPYGKNTQNEGNCLCRKVKMLRESLYNFVSWFCISDVSTLQHRSKKKNQIDVEHR